MDPLTMLAVAVRVVVPIFVAMDPIGALPLIFAWTGDLPAGDRDRQLRDALLTALSLGLVFVFGGPLGCLECWGSEYPISWWPAGWCCSSSSTVTAGLRPHWP